MKGVGLAVDFQWWVVSKKNQSWPVTEAVRGDFIQDSRSGERRPQYRIRINSEYGMSEWGFVAKEQGEQWMENH